MDIFMPPGRAWTRKLLSGFKSKMKCLRSTTLFLIPWAAEPCPWALSLKTWGRSESAHSKREPHKLCLFQSKLGGGKFTEASQEEGVYVPTAWMITLRCREGEESHRMRGTSAVQIQVSLAPKVTHFPTFLFTSALQGLLRKGVRPGRWKLGCSVGSWLWPNTFSRSWVLTA